MADAIHRDLLTDRLSFDELGWRGLWAYITKAHPTTAIYHELTEGKSLADTLAVGQLNVLREVNWRYTAVHFKDGDKVPFPQPISLDDNGSKEPAVTWETVTAEDMMSPEVMALLNG